MLVYPSYLLNFIKLIIVNILFAIEPKASQLKESFTFPLCLNLICIRLWLCI
ncbi:hypothetical protein HanIR_Chr05g0236181 [Helianthus annuus]|nr:hypothetical protein HanIR_Chr05g0236181 [Helianthus annuus]